MRRLALHILPAGFTKIRHYDILGNNRRAKMVPLALASLEKSRWRMELAPVKALPRVPAPSWVCEDCGSEDLVCMGQYGTDGKFHALRKGAKLLFVRMGLPPRPLDGS